MMMDPSTCQIPDGPKQRHFQVSFQRNGFPVELKFYVSHVSAVLRNRK